MPLYSCMPLVDNMKKKKKGYKQVGVSLEHGIVQKLDDYVEELKWMRLTRSELVNLILQDYFDQAEGNIEDSLRYIRNTIAEKRGGGML